MAPAGKPEQKADTIQVRNLTRAADGRYGYSRAETGKRGTSDYRGAWSKYLRDGARGLHPEQHAALRSDDADQAGYLVASEQFASELLKDVDDLLFIRRYARIIQVREADSLGIRKRTAKAATFNWSSELAISTEDSTLAFGKKVLTPHAATGLIKVSRDLLRRAVMSVDQIVREEMSIDAAELLEDGYLTGHGAQQPLGRSDHFEQVVRPSRRVAELVVVIARSRPHRAFVSRQEHAAIAAVVGSFERLRFRLGRQPGDVQSLVRNQVCKSFAWHGGGFPK
jgi:HK97 family phage major capsid protein